jgi:hypothetical protein
VYCIRCVYVSEDDKHPDYPVAPPECGNDDDNTTCPADQTCAVGVKDTMQVTTCTRSANGDGNVLKGNPTCQGVRCGGSGAGRRCCKNPSKFRCCYRLCRQLQCCFFGVFLFGVFLLAFRQIV